MNLIDEPKVVEGVKEYQDGDFMRGLILDEYLCELYQPHGFQSGSHYTVGLRLWDGDELIFDSHRVGVPQGVAIDSPGVFEAALSSLSMKPGDTDSDYFSDYTPEQLEWVAKNADDLGTFGTCIREQLDSIWNRETPSWACAAYEDGSHEWLNCWDCQHNWSKQFEWEQYHGLKLWLDGGGKLVEVSLPVTFKLPVYTDPQFRQLPQAQKKLVKALKTKLRQLLAGGTAADFLNLVHWDDVEITTPSRTEPEPEPEPVSENLAIQYRKHDEEGNEALRRLAVGGPRGAPMGRPSLVSDKEATVLLFRVHLVDGDYDLGGAYWGSDKEPLYAALGDGFDRYMRANHRAEARAKLLAAYPNLKFKE